MKKILGIILLLTIGLVSIVFINSSESNVDSDDIIFSEDFTSLDKIDDRTTAIVDTEAGLLRMPIARVPQTISLSDGEIAVVELNTVMVYEDDGEGFVENESFRIDEDDFGNVLPMGVSHSSKENSYWIFVEDLDRRETELRLYEYTAEGRMEYNEQNTISGLTGIIAIDSTRVDGQEVLFVVYLNESLQEGVGVYRVTESGFDKLYDIDLDGYRVNSISVVPGQNDFVISGERGIEYFYYTGTTYLKDEARSIDDILPIDLNVMAGGDVYVALLEDRVVHYRLDGHTDEMRRDDNLTHDLTLEDRPFAISAVEKDDNLFYSVLHRNGTIDYWNQVDDGTGHMGSQMAVNEDYRLEITFDRDIEREVVYYSTIFEEEDPVLFIEIIDDTEIGTGKVEWEFSFDGGENFYPVENGSLATFTQLFLELEEEFGDIEDFDIILDRMQDPSYILKGILSVPYEIRGGHIPPEVNDVEVKAIRVTKDNLECIAVTKNFEEQELPYNNFEAEAMRMKIGSHGIFVLETDFPEETPLEEVEVRLINNNMSSDRYSFKNTVPNDGSLPNKWMFDILSDYENSRDDKLSLLFRMIFESNEGSEMPPLIVFLDEVIRIESYVSYDVDSILELDED